MSARAACVRRRGGTISLTSAIAITGRFLMNSRNHMKNQPKLPARIEMSTQLGMYPDHCHGSNSCDSEGTMMTKRSNHIPRLIRMERMKSQEGFRRSRCEKSESGKIMLQVSMIHAAHHHRREQGELGRSVEVVDGDDMLEPEELPDRDDDREDHPDARENGAGNE